MRFSIIFFIFAQALIFSDVRGYLDSEEETTTKIPIQPKVKHFSKHLKSIINEAKHLDEINTNNQDKSIFKLPESVSSTTKAQNIITRFQDEKVTSKFQDENKVFKTDQVKTEDIDEQIIDIMWTTINPTKASKIPLDSENIKPTTVESEDHKKNSKSDQDESEEFWKQVGKKDEQNEKNLESKETDEETEKNSDVTDNKNVQWFLGGGFAGIVVSFIAFYVYNFFKSRSESSYQNL